MNMMDYIFMNCLYFTSFYIASCWHMRTIHIVTGYSNITQYEAIWDNLNLSVTRLLYKIDIVKHIRQNSAKYYSSYHFYGSMSDSLFEYSFLFLLQNCL